MKTTIHRLILAAITFALPLCAEDDTDFSTEPGLDWQRVDSLGLASFTFFNGTTILESPAPSIPVAQIYGLARAALLAPTEYTTAVVSADVVAVGGVRTFASVITRVGTPAGLGTSRGYSLTIIPSESGKFQIHRLDGEIPTQIAPTTYAALTPGHSYRLILASVGTTHTGRIYDTMNLSTPLAELTASDATYATYASGRSGIVASTDSLVNISATFDNFLAWDGTPAPLTIVASDILPTAILLKTEARRAIATNLESTGDLLSPWSPAPPDLKTHTGTELHTHHLPFAPQQFFRRRLLGAP